MLRSEAIKVKPGFVIVYGEPLRPPVVGFGGVEVEPSWVPRGIAVNWTGLVPEGEEREEILAALRRVPEEAVIVSDDEQRERVLIALLAMARGENPVEAARKAGRPLSWREVRALGLSEFEYATEPLEVEASSFVVDTCALATSSAHTKDTGAHAKSTLAQREVYLLKLLHELGIAPEDWQGGYEVHGVSVEPDGYYLEGRKLTESEAVDHVIMEWYAEEYGGG